MPEKKTTDRLSRSATADRGRLTAARDRVAARRSTELAYRITVGVVGMAVLALGIVLIPYPGPGWAVVFAGLAILASEFAWAQRVLRYAKDRYGRFMDWFGAQPAWVKVIGVALTTAVVLLTLWVLGAVEMVSGWLGFDQTWLRAPF